MSTETQIKDKLLRLQPWMPHIIDDIKKDLKKDHLQRDVPFVKKFLPSKNIHKIETGELSEAYIKALNELENSSEIAEFIVHRWIFRNSEMYHFFETHLSKIDPNFVEIKQLSQDHEKQLMEEASNAFGFLRTYLFSELNAVAISPEGMQQLEELARKECNAKKIQKQAETEKKSYDDLVFNHQQEISRLTDKYEKKLSGLLKKYSQDVESLKKQLVQMQRKMSGA